MAKTCRIALVVLLGLGSRSWARSGDIKAPPARGEASVQNGVQITLGQTAVSLYGPWKFSIGDSPVDPVTHQFVWAEPAFDDSKWEGVDLTPATGAIDPIGGLSEYVSGWTDRGHPGYAGYAWYRIQVRLAGRVGQQLALAGPPDQDTAYQVFANGTLLGGFGNFSRARPVDNEPMLFTLPGSTTENQSPPS